MVIFFIFTSSLVRVYIIVKFHKIIICDDGLWCLFEMLNGMMWIS